MISQNSITTGITNSIKAFTNGIIDYAGLFPPANLPLEEAFKNFIKYQQNEYSWFLSRFICPVKLLSELGALIRETSRSGIRLNLTVLGRGGHNKTEFEKNLNEDLHSWKNFNFDFNGVVKTNLFEIKLPDEVITSHDDKSISNFIDSIFDNIESEISHPVFVFFEGQVGAEWKKNIRSLIEALKIHNENNNNCGFKFRTGGLDPDSFPTPEQIAFSIRECIDREIPMKCTAGLHHPFRHYDKKIDTMMHGFINVFGAGIIALRHNISNLDLRNILSDEDPANFIFTNNYFSWNDWKITVEDIEFARKDLMISFGSCSFDDPLSDLKSLNLL